MEDGFQDGLRDTLLRGPKAVVLCNRKPSYSDLWSVLGVARNEGECERRCGWLDIERVKTAATTLCSASLLFLIEIPLCCRPHGARGL